MIESKSLTVTPSSENSTIDLWQNFGWTLKSSQEVNSKESHLEERGGDLYSITTSQNYVKLTFQRDTSIPNYVRLKELETKYHALLDSEPTEPISIFSLKTHLIIGGLLLIAYGIGIIYFIIYFSKKIKAKKEYEDKYSIWYNKINTEGKRILEEATSLLS